MSEYESSKFDELKLWTKDILLDELMQLHELKNARHKLG